MRLRANSAPEFARTVEGQFISLPRRQKRFRDEFAFVAPERSEALATTFRDAKEDAEAYDCPRYSEVLKALSNVVEGTPRVETFEVAHSTSHKIADRGA
jgi:hypothetical protein